MAIIKKKKIALWKGKTEEEVKEMPFEDFKKLVDARTRRSLERGFTESQKTFLKSVQVKNDVKTHCRSMVITPAMLGKKIQIHTGKDYSTIEVDMMMLGHRLGEFAHSRKPVKHSSAGVGATRSSRSVSVR
jgi:small subunit ribosomal protein S19